MRFVLVRLGRDREIDPAMLFTKTRRAVVAFLAASALAAPLQASHAAPDTTEVTVTHAADLESPILLELNRVRRANRLRPLRLSPALARAARAHVRALALSGEFRHEWPDGRPFARWITSFYPIAGARSWAAGENLIWNSAGLTPKAVAEAWLASPLHRRVLLRPYWRQLGVGAVRAAGAGGVYAGTDATIAAAEFGARS
jgi:uncharacterized protein YkwD